MKQEETKIVRPYLCPVCGMFEIKEPCHYEICEICGWQDDGDHEFPDENGGPYVISFHLYKNVWLNNSEKIRNYENSKSELVEKLFNEKK